MDPNTPASHESLPGHSAADPIQPVRRRRHRWVWVVVLLAFGLLFYWAWHHEQKSQAATTGGGRRGMVGGIVPVTTATAQTGSIGIYLDAIGTVTPIYFDSITSQVTGVITAVHYREGQMVHKGDPLVDIDPRPFEATLVQAQGALERDQNLLAEAQMDLDRYKVAWSKNAIPRQTLEDQEKLVLQDQGTVKNDEGTVQYDQVQLSYCHITSPIDGRVGLRLVDPGNLVTANSTTTLVAVAQIEPITVVFILPEDSLPEVMKQIRSGKTLKVDADDRSNSSHLATGKLISVDNQIDTTTGTVKLRGEFANRDGALFPNQFVNTRLLVRTLDNQILIPASAIQHNGSQDFVYLIVDAKTNQPVTDTAKECTTPQSCKALQHSVTSGSSDGGQTAVTGIEPGNVVADSSFEKLQSGAQITISKVKLPSTSESSASTAP
ncbi:MAG TPA: efflux RND transporter periplasmic adaptor subunit [Terracidiphilus sp.]|nr:efflux RND transporter periplasmic adaptor subunit [Terracidiphilus sp.]